jgi:2,3-bisphosphoglycerate-independent phosphoglycerate mutase
MRRQVGHNALGAGQIIDQGARLVDKAIATGSMWDHEGGWLYIKPVWLGTGIGLAQAVTRG